MAQSNICGYFQLLGEKFGSVTFTYIRGFTRADARVKLDIHQREGGIIETKDKGENFHGLINKQRTNIRQI